ncbi:MAG TPA: GDSL-type esterase/lipase family protein [Acidobacteriaceae bacterium]|nr:GDSL-type esterase/lipase family protein [Acidobacteriaceae bacterium]
MKFSPFLLYILSLPALAQTPHIAPANNPPHLTPLAFSTGGRVLATPASDTRFGAHALTYQWPGTYFEAAFSGTAVDFSTGSGHEILHITVDHGSPTPLVKPAPGAYAVTGLVAGPHSIRIDVVTESQAGPDTFLGFALPPGEKPLAPPHRLRQIEFIGDSHTVGYGNTSPTRTCTEDQVWATTDSSQAFGALVARHYDADFQINAISGHGIVRNYNGSPGDPVPVAYPWVLFDHKQIYGDSNWHPEVIVIALGTNDFTTPLNPGEKWKNRGALHADYEATYLRFLEMLRAENPCAYFIVWATNMANGEIESEESKVVDQWKAKGETRVTFLPIDNLSFTACNFHPSLADDRTIATDIEKDIDAVPSLWSLSH